MADEAMCAVKDIIRFLDCPCTYFAPMLDDDLLFQAYLNAVEESDNFRNYVPVMLVASDTLFETILMNSLPPDGDGDGNMELTDKTMEFITTYRTNVIEHDNHLNGSDVLCDLFSSLVETMESPDVIENMINAEGGEVEINDHFRSWWNYEDELGHTYGVILAKIPVDKIWDIFAYVPMGGWNDCPNNHFLSAISKLWFEKFRAIPAVISEDGLEYILEKPVDEKEAKDLAIKHYAFCPSLIEESDNVTISSHAKALTKSHVWYFWWS